MHAVENYLLKGGMHLRRAHGRSHASLVRKQLLMNISPPLPSLPSINYLTTVFPSPCPVLFSSGLCGCLCSLPASSPEEFRLLFFFSLVFHELFCPPPPHFFSSTLLLFLRTFARHAELRPNGFGGVWAAAHPREGEGVQAQPYVQV